MIRAASSDGIIHEFPDGTQQSVVDRVMKAYARAHTTPPAATPPTSPQAGYGLPNEYGGDGVPMGSSPSLSTGAAILQGVVDPVEGIASLGSMIPGVMALYKRLPWSGSLTRGAAALRHGAAKAPFTRLAADVLNPLNYIVPEAAGDIVPVGMRLAGLAPGALEGATAGLARAAVGGATAAVMQPPAGKPTIGGEALQALTGGVGGSLLHGLGAAIAQKVAPKPAALLESGVRLTPGALFGKTGHSLTSMAEQLPGADTLVTRGNRRMIDDWNKHLYDRVLEPFKETFQGPERGNEGMAALRAAIDAHYKNSIAGLSFRHNDEFAASLENIRAPLSNMAKPYFDAVIAHRMPFLKSPAPAWTNIKGKALAEMISMIRNDAKELRGQQGDGAQRSAGHALADVVRALTDTSTETIPGAKAEKIAADKAYAPFSVLKKAAGVEGMRGRITPQTLDHAVRLNEEVRSAYGEGRALLQPVANAAIDVMGAPKVNDLPRGWRDLRGLSGEGFLAYLAGLHPVLAATLGVPAVTALGANTNVGMNWLRDLALAPGRVAIGQRISAAAPAAGVAAGSATR